MRGNDVVLWAGEKLNQGFYHAQGSAFMQVAARMSMCLTMKCLGSMTIYAGESNIL
jgi:hypothetical protein